jgi:hypothetical protein
MNYQTTHEEIRALRADRERVADLLERYPRISAEEIREIITFLRTGRHLEIGLLTSNDRLRPNLDAFMHDHKAHLQVKWREAVALIAGVGALLTMCWLIWEAFAS